MNQNPTACLLSHTLWVKSRMKLQEYCLLEPNHPRCDLRECLLKRTLWIKVVRALSYLSGIGRKYKCTLHAWRVTYCFSFVRCPVNQLVELINHSSSTLVNSWSGNQTLTKVSQKVERSIPVVFYLIKTNKTSCFAWKKVLTSSNHYMFPILSFSCFETILKRSEVTSIRVRDIKKWMTDTKHWGSWLQLLKQDMKKF